MRFLFLLGFVVITLTACKRTVKEYYEDGTLRSSIGLNRDGIGHGDSKFYYSTGDIKKVLSYKNGNLEYVKVYYKNGQLMWETSINSNLKDGEAFEYYPNGKLKEKMLFDHDTILSQISYDSLGYVKREFIRSQLFHCPEFDSSFITLLDNDGFIARKSSLIKIKVPIDNAYQISPYVINGRASVIDRVENVWEVEPVSTNKPFKIGISIKWDNKKENVIGYNVYEVYDSNDTSISVAPTATE